MNTKRAPIVPRTKNRSAKVPAPLKFDFRLYRMADVSTTHVTLEDGRLMGSEDAPCLVGETKDRNGAIFWVPTKDMATKRKFAEKLKEMAAFGFSKHFLRFFRKLREQGIEYVRFDVDGKEVDGAPTFDW